MPLSSDATAVTVTKRVDATVVLLTHYLPLYQVRVFQELAKHVRSLKILLSTPIEPNRQFELDWGGLDVHVQKSVMLRRRWKHHAGFSDEHYLHFPYDTLSLLRKHRPDVVLSHELGPRSMVAAVHRAMHRRSRMVLMTYMSEHTEASRTRIRRAVRKTLLRRADAVTYNGPSCRRYLIEQGVNEQTLFHLPYAADDRVFSNDLMDRSNGEEIRSRLVCVGQLNQRKGVVPMLNQLIRYCNQRPQRHIRLTFVGQGPLREELTRANKPSNLEIELISNLAPPQLAELYQNCGAAIHPTLADEWLMVVNESLHCGLPMIGSRYAQAVETLIEDGKNGWVFDPLVESSLSEKLDAYFSLSNQELTAMRNRAINSVAERTPQWAARGAIAAIESVLK